MNNAPLVFTPAAQQAQAERGSAKAYEKRLAEGFPDTVTPELAAFIAEMDTAFLGTASGDGAPYIQHRGGPKGFIKVIDERTLGFADYRGNRQYITLANLSENDRAFLFLHRSGAPPAHQDLGPRAHGGKRCRADRAPVRRRLQGQARTRAAVHHRGLGRELLPAHRHPLHRGRAGKRLHRHQDEDGRARNRKCTPCARRWRNRQRNEPRHLPRQLHPRHPQHGEDHRHGRHLAEGEPAELFRVQISARARLPHDPGQSRPGRQGNPRADMLRLALRHPRAGRHGRHLPRLRRTCRRSSRRR